jgi:23S rRNA (cytosine1962-C5)-methyltransferase
VAEAEPEEPDDPAALASRSHADAALKIRGLPKSPWVFKKMLLFPPARVANGSFCGLRARSGELIAHGFVNRRSEIAFRILGGPQEHDLAALLRARIAAAHDLRTQVLRLHEQTDAARIVHGEADGLSGLVVDRYGRVLSVLLYSLGYVRHAEVLEAELRQLPDVERIVFHADTRSEELEGFRIPEDGRDAPVEVTENGVRFQVDLAGKHKTGLFLDQRENRSLLARHVRGKRVLDVCTNAGGFAIHAKKRGDARQVIAVDLDEAVLVRARKNAKLNATGVDFVHADLFDWLREAKQAGRTFDAVVLDPHKLAAGRGELPAAMRKYHDMNRLAFDAVAPGGLLFTFSCSGAVSETAFVEVVTDAARSSGRRARILRYLGAAPDHPVALDFPEGRYLKGLMLQVG